MLPTATATNIQPFEALLFAQTNKFQLSIKTNRVGTHTHQHIYKLYTYIHTLRKSNISELCYVKSLLLVLYFSNWCT